MITVDVVRVFCDPRGAYGNPLGLVRAADVVGREQEVAARLGFSETVVLDEEPSEPERVARLRIFTPARELPFAGHPTVGAAWWLDRRGTPAAALDVPAGRVEVQVVDDVVLVTARPEWSPDFEWLELGRPQDVDALDPSEFTVAQVYAWAWVDRDAGTVRSRMFAPGLGITEDEATGSAAVALTGRLGRNLRIRQGRGSWLETRVLPDGAVQLGGRVVAGAGVSLG
ncbi:PhzF family phenazine biosynthesis protein [Isoptericola sp. b441]|uniref:PhzF family phenazine biosynthesis protein n=1 Tax=Actinotalea lenta TaxID=3064654 RepID=A0ABT9D5B9_9CELL|nr:PhzF family phenazine biosynthesis protein [Isoptericola sp. b441]MDO8105964.1 PhzF family phenazine biosynthesis protein [Isoptericola sp. b441]